MSTKWKFFLVPCKILYWRCFDFIIKYSVEIISLLLQFSVIHMKLQISNLLLHICVFAFFFFAWSYANYEKLINPECCTSQRSSYREIFLLLMTFFLCYFFYTLTCLFSSHINIKWMNRKVCKNLFFPQ